MYMYIVYKTDLLGWLYSYQLFPKMLIPPFDSGIWVYGVIPTTMSLYPVIATLACNIYSIDIQSVLRQYVPFKIQTGGGGGGVFNVYLDRVS